VLGDDRDKKCSLIGTDIEYKNCMSKRTVLIVSSLLLLVDISLYIVFYLVGIFLGVAIAMGIAPILCYLHLATNFEIKKANIIKLILAIIICVAMIVFVFLSSLFVPKLASQIDGEIMLGVFGLNGVFPIVYVPRMYVKGKSKIE